MSSQAGLGITGILDTFSIANPNKVPSPALLIDKRRVARNLDRMVQLAHGNPKLLRPHVKTHKMQEIVQMQLDRGISKTKCATIAEMELCAAAGCSSVMLAYQPVGPAIHRLLQLIHAYPETVFSAVVDAPSAVQAISQVFQENADAPALSLLVDVNCGMNRTGVAVGDAMNVVRAIHSLPGVVVGGVHAYDGHIGDASLSRRKERCRESFRPVWELVNQLKKEGHDALLVTSGSPTVAIHGETAQKADFPYEISAGTTTLWDAGYAQRYPELGFACAAQLLVRVISKPSSSTLCLDLGHKAVASENPIEKRVFFPVVPDAQFLIQSEEHLVIETEQAPNLQLGDVLYGIPIHVCPTVALYDQAVVVVEDNGVLTEERWAVRARARQLTF